MSTVFSEVFPRFSGLEESYFNDAFKPSSDAIANQVGDLFFQNRFFEQSTLSHKQLGCWLGQYAMYTMPNTSYRFWADMDAYNDDLPWKLAVWRLIHILPLGHAFADNAFRVNDILSWNPLQKPAPRGLSVSGSNRPLYPNSISQGIFHKLFPEYFEQPSAMFLNAILDVFAPSPNRDNPFYIAIRDSIRTTVVRSPYPLPFFWDKFITQFLSKSEIDIAKYIKSKTNSIETQDFDLSAIDYDEQLQSNDSFSENSSENNNEPTQETTSVSTEPNQTQQPTSATSLLNDLVLKTDFTNVKTPDYEHVTRLLNEIGALVSQNIETGAYPINAPSAFAHKVDNKFYIVYPSGIKKIQTLLGDTVSAMTLDAYFKGLALIVSRQAYLTTPSSNVIDIDLVELHQQFVPAFFPEFESLPNNKNITIKTTEHV